LIRYWFHSVLLIVLALWGQDFLAQSKLHVTDDSGEPLIGVFVQTGELKKTLIKVSDQEGNILFTESDGFSYPLSIELFYLGMETVNLSVEKGGEKTVLLLPSTSTLSQVVVTGEYSVSNPEKAVSRVDIITAEEIANIGAADIADILQHKADIRIQQDGLIGTGISIQGLNDRDVKVLINEVPMVGRVDGKLDLSQLDVTDIERIEIVKGPMAASYGSDAIAGVINIITKKPVGGSSAASLRGYYSSEGEYDTQVRAETSTSRYSLVARAGRRFFDGWSSGDPVFKDPKPIADERRSRQWNPKETLQGGLSQSWNKGNFQITHRFDLLTDKLKDRGVPIYTLNGPIALDQEFSTRRIDNSIDFKHGKSERIKFRGYVAYNDFLRIRDEFVTDLSNLLRVNPEQDGVDSTTYQSLSGRYTAAFEAKENWDMQLGVDGSMERSSGDRIAGDPDMKAGAFFASAEWNPYAWMTVKPSVRWGYNSLFTLQPAPSIALRIRKDAISYRLSYGRGFRAPDFKELFLAFFDSNHNVFGNTELTPEQSNNYAASASYSKSSARHRIKWEAALFLNDLKDRIELVQVGGSQTGPAPFTYLNVDEVRSQGLRLDGEYEWRNFRYHLGYGLTGFQQSDQGVEIIPLNYFGQWNASLSYSEPESKVNVEMYASRTGIRKILIVEEEQTRSFEQEAYTMLDFSMGRRFFENRIDLRIGARNILDVKSINAAGTGTHEGSSASSLLATGRNYFLSCTYTLSKKKAHVE
jgi:outer membrane receptor for ferrienterochelin and colicins